MGLPFMEVWMAKDCGPGTTEQRGQGDACGQILQLRRPVRDASLGQTVAVSVAGSVGRAPLQGSAVLPAC